MLGTRGAPAARTLAWVREACGPSATVTGVHPLLGGTTADLDRLTVRAGNGTTHRVVLRRWTDTADWTDGLAEREGRALAALQGTEIPAPRLLAVDPTGQDAGVRCLLMTALPGAVDLTPTDLGSWLAQLAGTQAAVHRLPPTLPDPASGWFVADADRSWIADAGLRREALAAADSAPADDVFAHGDYQHFNVLWQSGRLAGIVDWPMAGTGSRGVDVGHCRLNLAALFSADVADQYLRLYQQEAGLTVDPRGDLRALLCWDPEWLSFLPRQVLGRAVLDSDGMADRVTQTIRRALG